MPTSGAVDAVTPAESDLLTAATLLLGEPPKLAICSRCARTMDATAEHHCESKSPWLTDPQKDPYRIAKSYAVE